MHFAGLKAVGESQEKPMLYWENNLNSTFNLVKYMSNRKIKKLIFSSSATVYGNNTNQPLSEENNIFPVSCYGSTKIANEYFLKDISSGNTIDVIALRYFNPVGCHEDKKIYEEIDQFPNNLMPRVIRTAKGIDKKLIVFGDDYPTPDGTGERDYIHIEDLVEAHIKSIKKIENMSGYSFYNIGTGSKHSVKELIRTFEDVNSIAIPYEISQRREGDVAICYADPAKAKEELEWEAIYDLKNVQRLLGAT